MSRPLERLPVRTFLVLLSALLLALPTSAQPAEAAGMPYNPATWAGVRATQVLGPNGPNDWRVPDTAEASWTVPCVPPPGSPSVAGGYYGAFDQWIGIEGTDGNLIQVGVRSYHLDFGWGGGVTGQFAWWVNTANPNGRTPVQMFSVGCNESGIVNARVQADGYVCITQTADSCIGTSNVPFTNTGAQVTPARASFVLERFSGGYGHLPYFGSAEFRDAKVLHGVRFNTILGPVYFPGVSGWHIGDQAFVRSEIRGTAASGIDQVNAYWYSGVQYGRFRLHQPIVLSYGGCPFC